MRTAKPCGPGRRCYGQALADAALASTGAVSATSVGVREARRNSAPGRARHKPSDHCAGKAVCWASPVCCCAVSFALHAHGRPQVPPAPGLPCALCLLGRGMKRSSGEMSREAVNACLQLKCESENDAVAPCSVIASAAKQSRLFPWRDSGLLRCARNDGGEAGVCHTLTVIARLDRAIQYSRDGWD